MLKHFRTHTKTVIWTVVVSFLIFGAVSFGTSFDKRTRYAGEIFGKGVSFQEFNRYYKSAKIFAYGQKDDPKAQDPDVLRLKAWQNLIYAKNAEKIGIKVSDDEVSQELSRLLEAQGFSNPTPALYRNWLKMSLQSTPTEFEKMIRDMLRIQKMVADESVSNQDVPTIDENQAKEMFVREKQRLSAEMIIFASNDEAVEFKEKLKKESDWTEEAAKLDFDILKVENSSLADIERSWQIPSDELSNIFKSSIGTVSDPVLVQDHIALVKLLEKTEADLKEWNSEKTAEYQIKFGQEAKRLHLLKWHLQLMQNAKLMDYSQASER